MKEKNINIVIIATVFLICLGLVTTYFVIPKTPKENKLISEANRFVGKEVNIKEFESVIPQEYPIKDVENTDRIWLIYLLNGCEACKKEIRLVEELSIKSNTPIKVIGLMSEDENTIRNFISENNVKFPVLVDKDMKFLKTMKVRFFPTNFIIENAVIRKAFIGFPENQEEILKTLSVQ